MGTLIESFETGKKYLQVYEDGTAKITSKKKTDMPAKLNSDEAWVVCEKDGAQEYSGAFIPTEIINIPDGSKIEMFDDEENYYTKVLELATPFVTGVLVSKHALISYDNEIYRVIQTHTTQSDWTPDIVPALFLKIQQPGASGYPEWVQPTGAHDAYNTGDKVTFNGHIYESTIDANVWSPAVYPQGWTDLGEI